MSHTATVQAPIEKWNPFAPDYRRNPYPTYASYRAIVAFRALLQRTRHVSLTDEAPEWNRSIGLRGLQRLAIALTPAA